MRTKIEGLANISTIFSIFHDGVICRYHLQDNELHLDIDIQYLAERINPQFTKFGVLLQKINHIQFKTWPRDLKAEPAIIFDISQIFSPEIEILESKVEDNQIQISCFYNQDSAEFEYDGGYLYFSSETASVTDENDKEYSLEELKSLCKEYWDEWEKGNKA